jgi:hypothetical protein
VGTKAPWAFFINNNEDHHESVWEIILRLTQTTQDQASVSSIESKYSSVAGVDEENEINLLVKFLISTSYL